LMLEHIVQTYEGELSRKSLEKSYAHASASAPDSLSKSKAKAEARKIMNGDLDLGRDLVTKMTSYARRKGLQPSVFLLNGMVGSGGDDSIQGELMQMLGPEQQRLQEMVMNREIDAETDVLQYLMNAANVYPRHHPILDESPTDAEFSILHPMPKTEDENVVWMHHPGTENEVKSVTIFLLADLQTSNGKASFMEALRWLQLPESAFVRFAFAHTSKRGEGNIVPIFQLISALHSASNVEIVPALLRIMDAVVGSDSALSTDQLIAFVFDPDIGAVSSDEKARRRIENEFRSKDHKEFLPRYLGVNEGETSLVVNGRKIEIVNDKIDRHDFELVATLENSQRAVKIHEWVKNVLTQSQETHSAELSSSRLMFLCSLAGAYTSRERTNVRLEDEAFVESIGLKLDHTLVKYPKDRSQAASPIVVSAILDPLSNEAQLAAPLLRLLRDELNLSIVVLFVPDVDVKELPLQNFFRLVFSPSFETESVTAHFGKLPAQHLLTMKISTPEPWDVQTSHAVYDLDNLRVDENDPSTQFVFAEFTLKHLVAYGVCHDKISQFPPNGLQLVLGDIGL